LDFGIAKALEAGSDKTTQTFATLTGTGGVIGTPAYMSPEQARGLRGDQLDGRSDLYSLGIVMYQMLVGRLPFKADTGYEWILAHVQTPPTPTWVARPDLAIPHPVATVVMQCLEKDPQARPVGAAALIEEISRAEQATRSNAPPARKRSAGLASTSPVYEKQSNRGWVGWVSAVIAVAVLVGGAILWKTQQARSASTVTTPQPTELAKPVTETRPTGSKDNSVKSDAPTAPTQQPVPASEQAATPNATSSSDSAVATPPDGTDTKERTPAPATVVTEPATTKSVPPAPKPDTRARDRAVAAALIRAKEDEREGRYEDALKEYEQAASLDPGNGSLKRNVQRLRSLLEDENQIIK
jgi:eukaryotic-like serine/threonine-protein kinase